MYSQALRLLADDRHREMLAEAEQHRLARQVTRSAMASRRTERAGRRLRGTARVFRWLRSELEQ